MSPLRSSHEGDDPGSPELRDMHRSIWSVREDVLISLLDNPSITEADVLQLLNRRNLPTRVIEEVALHPKWLSSYQVKLAIARNPRTPVTMAISLLKHLFLFDLVTLSQLPALARDLKDHCESLILSQFPRLALGEAMTLSRRSSAKIAEALLSFNQPQVVQGSLDNPKLTAGSIVRALNLKACSPVLVTMVSRHRKWKLNYEIRLALLRSPHLPTARALELITDIKSMDLQELASDPRVSLQFRRYLKRAGQLARQPETKLS